jgi:hypothetical protein
VAKEKRNNLISCPDMARRPDPTEFDRPLTPEGLKERQRRLAMLSPHHVADAYRRAHEACRMEGDNLPRAQEAQRVLYLR